MASDLPLTKVTLQHEEEEFHQVLQQIGGTGNVYLVGDVDASSKDGDCKCCLMKELLAELFPAGGTCGEINSNGKVRCCSGSKGQCGRPEMVGAKLRPKSDKERAMHCAVVIFLFRHAYLHDEANRVCVREVLKDIRTRTKGHGVQPALLGLVHAHCESPETGESVELLDQMLRSVFPKHPHDSIWAGHFVPRAEDGVQAIRRHICRCVLTAQAAQSTDTVRSRKGQFFWPLQQCFRRGRRERHDMAASHNQEVRKKEFPCRREPSRACEDAGTKAQNGHWSRKARAQFQPTDHVIKGPDREFTERRIRSSLNVAAASVLIQEGSRR
ncbi:hypothetical protein NFI96_014701 [Prochilodus magdalenae]|nr:hypothetical protein NFI96_014701 [Prochilodus magdalenae]